MVETEETQDSIVINQRPFFLSVILVSLFVYSGTMSIIFLLASIFNKWISNTLSDFFPEKNIDPGNILMLSLIAFVLTATSFAGVYLMWRLKKKGLFIFSISALLFIGYPYLLGFGNYLSIFIILTVVVIVFLFWKKFK